MTHRRTALVTAVGRTETGEVWCEVDHEFFRPRDGGRVGPFRLLRVEGRGADRQRCVLAGAADPLVGELVALVREGDSSEQCAEHPPDGRIRAGEPPGRRG